MISLVEIFEAPLRLLAEYQLVGIFCSDEHRTYSEILICYLGSDPVSLESLIQKLNCRSEAKEIATLRLQNLRLIENDEQIQIVTKIARSESDWSGEAAYALGMTFFRFKRNSEAKEFFKIAYHRLEILGARQKAVKALLNAVVAESRIDNRRKLIRDYEIVAQKAGLVGATVAQGTCYQNISKELHQIGALELALKYSHMAVKCLEEDNGTLHYYETVLQRCHILIDLGRFKEAYLDFDRAKVSTHRQIIEALKCIEKLLGQNVVPHELQLEPAWINKLKKINLESTRLTKTEIDFINLVKSSQVEREVLIHHLYGHEINWESAKNRFKVFMARFRKKFPNLVVEENGHYRLVDESVLAELEKVAQ